MFLRQSVISININSPIGKLIILISQSFSGYLIDGKQMPNILFANFSAEKKKQRECRKLVFQIMRGSSFFQKKFTFSVKKKITPRTRCYG